MSAPYEELVSEFPSSALKTALAFIKGEAVTKTEIALAAINIESYAAGLFIKDEASPMFAAAMASPPAPTKDEALAAFAAVMPDDSGTMKAGDNKGAWLTIITTLLPLILKLLA